MLEDRCENLEELNRWLSRMPADALFRGQRRHFTKDGKTDISTSFARHGCVPSLMFKWVYYVKEVIRTLNGSRHEEVTREFLQALLQHYGWRSFYVDLTSHFPVAAWFGSHTFQSNMIVALCEDCYESPMLLGHPNADYSLGDGDAHVYVLARPALTERGIGIFDLSVMETADFVARYSRQHALLVGPLKERLPADLIHSHLVCPTSVLSEAAALAGFDNTEDVFPTREEDTILDRLLGVPWTCPDHEALPAFRRGLELPEYDFRPVKTFPPQNTFFRPFWIADDREDDRLPFANATFVRVPEDVFYSPSRPADQRLEKVSAFIRDKRSVAIETNGIIRFSEFPNDCYCGKGVFLHLVDDETVEIASIVVEHPGMQVAAVGIPMPWTYRINGDSTWTRAAGPRDCPCNNHQRHLHNFWVVGALEYMLSNGEFVERTPLDFEWRPPPEVEDWA
jgi:hypothetical protein